MYKLGYWWVVVTALLALVSFVGLVANAIAGQDWVLWIGFTAGSVLLLVDAVKERKEVKS